ncbi:MAG: YkvA family protein [Candidatus Limnocylindria bacterium]
MELPAWAQILLVLFAVWTIVVVVLVVVGRVLLARELALLLPNLIRLFGGLLRDRRVPLPAKIVVVIASIWLASPIDLIPEFIPIIGAFDDAIVAALALRFVLSTTEGTIVREHWHGDPATLDRLLRLVSVGGRGRPRALP